MNNIFKLDARAYIALFAGTPCITAVMGLTAFVVPHEGSDELIYLICAVAVVWSWVQAIQFVRQCPRQFTIGDARLTAVWLGGKTKAWGMHELYIPDPTRLLLRDIAHAGIDVLDRDGNKAFKISSQIQAWRDLVALIAPPPPPPSVATEPGIWSRNLL